MPESRPPVGMIAVAVALIAAVGAGAWYGGRGEARPPVVTQGAVSTPTVADEIIVHVSGAVRSPGLVTIPAAARIADAVAAAGGATGAADLGALNLAAAVQDGDQIVVPVPGESHSRSGRGDGGVDLNRATPAELERLPGVGPVLAARIVAFRDENGPFQEIEDLLDVGGIGEAKLAAMRDSIVAP